jgi:hypothetical protein
VKKVLERRPTKAITVFVDMKDVDRAAKKVRAMQLIISGVIEAMQQKDISGDSEDESDDEGQSDVSSTSRQ